MPGIWDYLSAETLAAGPRRVELKDGGAVLHELRVPHAPLLSTDEPPLDADDHALLQVDDGNRFVWSDKTNRYEWGPAQDELVRQLTKVFSSLTSARPEGEYP